MACTYLASCEEDMYLVLNGMSKVYKSIQTCFMEGEVVLNAENAETVSVLIYIHIFRIVWSC